MGVTKLADRQLLNLSSGGGITRTILNNQTGTISAASGNLIDYIYIFTSSGNLVLPTAVNNTNFYDIKNTSVNTVTITFTGGQNADGTTTINLISGQSLRFISDNTNYIIL